MSGNELARQLLQTAKSDLKAPDHMLNPEAFDDGVVGFHAQQAVEKALKAWINILGQTHPFTHDLSLLLHILEEKGVAVDDYWDFLDLSSYAVRFRYETFTEGEEPLERAQLVKDVRCLIEKVENLLLS